MKKGLLSRLMLTYWTSGIRAALPVLSSPRSLAKEPVSDQKDCKNAWTGSVLFVTLLSFLLLIKQVLVNANEGELLRLVSFIS